MALAGFKAQNHPQQVGRRGAKPEVDNLATTPEMFAPLHERFRFTVDAAALPHNAKLPRFWTPEQDGLAQSWAGERVWLNPPYSNIEPWCEKAWESGDAELVVMLVPANRTEQGWWQRQVEPHRDYVPLVEGRWRLKVEFLSGRPRFIKHGFDRVEPNQRPPFGCALLIWGGLDPSSSGPLASAEPPGVSPLNPSPSAVSGQEGGEDR